ncbi:MAG: hypothetical protein ACKVTZ_02170 [Bacteroidia bacterium]
MKRSSIFFFLTVITVFAMQAQTIPARVLNTPNVCQAIPFLDTIWGNVPGETVTVDSAARIKNILRTPVCDINLSKEPNIFRLVLENKFDKDTYKKHVESEIGEQMREYSYEGDIIFDVKIDEDGRYMSHKLSPLVHPAFKNLAEVLPMYELKFQPSIIKGKAEAATVKVIFKVKLEENLLIAK